MKHLRKYIFFVLMCLMCFEAKAVDPLQPLKLIHYDGCVNIGVPDTLLLRVDDAEPNPETKGYYVWSIPDTWKPIGCVTCKELKVVTYETEAVTRVYRVGTHRSSGMEYAFDTVQVRGADTSVIIWDDGDVYIAAPNSVDNLLKDNKDAFDFLWYKGRVHPDSVVHWDLWVYSYLFNGAPPVLAYRPKAGCWSVTDKVVIAETLSLELQGQGRVRANSGITYCEVNTQGKTEQPMGRSEVLHFEVRPAKGYYLDRVEIGNGEQMRVVAECDIEEKDGVFSFRDFPKWDYTTKWGYSITEDYRIILKEGEKKNDPVCDDPVTLVHYDGCVNIGIPDTLLLQVENPVEGAAYRWQIPAEWKPIGCTTCAELRVETLETAATTRIYGVSLSGAGFAMDTIQVRGADTTLIILDHGEDENYFAMTDDLYFAESDFFDLRWYKTTLGPDNIVDKFYYMVAKYWFKGEAPILAYRSNSGCWSVTDKVVLLDSIVYPIRLEHYEGCVNIGMESELLLRVKNPMEGLRYQWQIPETWQAVGGTNGSELRVITHETKDTTRVYGVRFGDWDDWVFDTVQVKGADTTQFILDDSDVYCLWSGNFDGLDEDAFEFLCYKGRVHPDSMISGWIIEPKYRFNGTPPVFAYRPIGGCWTVTDHVVVFDSIDPIRLAHYDVCVNIGVPDTLLLRVENADDHIRYHWQLPDTWEPIGYTDRGELRVVTHETKDTTRIYGVRFAIEGTWNDGWNIWRYDTVQVKGADTTLYILQETNRRYWVSGVEISPLSNDYFDFTWYKGTETGVVKNGFWASVSLFDGQKPLLKYKSPENTCWSATDEVVVFDSIYPIRLAHYDGCVNIGVPDTLLLRVENADERVHYHWQIPTEWEIIGDTNRGQLRVVTHETKDTTRVYGVRFANEDNINKRWNVWFFDTIQVKGADTTLFIMSRGDSYMVFSINSRPISSFGFDLMWYKDNLSDENFVFKSHSMSVAQVGLVPLLKYRIKANNACWSVTDEVVPWRGVLNVEIVGSGQIRVYSGRIYTDVTTAGKHKVLEWTSDTLQFVIRPSAGFYLDRIEIEKDEQVMAVPEEKIKEEADGTFSFRSSVIWQDREGYVDSNYRFVFVEKQHTIKDLGEATVCRGDSVKMGSRYVWTPGFHYDTVDGEMAKADTVYQLYLHVNPTYHDTLHFLVERDSMPYILGKDTIRNFGWTRLNALTVNGCDSITYVRLDTLYIHREQHFYDTLQACGEAVLSWRGREITQTGEYADTVVDPYRGGTDSIYHLRADIYPTYQETLYFSTEPDSMPYILGKDTIRQFGLTELHRYQTVHGCDSVIYVQLNPVYRDEHFYDTVRGCGVAQFRWQGVVMIVYQGGDYIDSVVNPDRGGAKTYHHLHVEISSSHYIDFIDSCYTEELPYMVGGRLMQDFGEQTARYVTAAGCDSVCTYVLSRRFHDNRILVDIAGNGVVCVEEKSFQGAGFYEFEVEGGSERHFRIKPGKQFYLDSLLIYRSGEYMLVLRDSIFAERDDTLHYYSSKEDIGFWFVFKEVQPWERKRETPYKSRDKSYAQIYKPEELYDPNPSPTASLQNDLDLANFPVENNAGTDFENIEGNNRIIWRVSGNHFYKVRNIKNVHFLDNVYGYPFTQFDKTSLEGVTVQGYINQVYSNNKPDAPFFVRNFINFGTTYQNMSCWIPINKTSKNLINWGRFDMPFIQIDGEETTTVSYVFNFGRIPRLLSVRNGTMVSPCFNDKNLAPTTQMPTQGAVYNLESRQLIDSAFMRSLMGDGAEEDFIFEDGFYPRLRHMDERPGRLAASPLLLYPGENADGVSLPFYVDTNYGVRWRSLNEKIVKIEGNVGYVCHPVQRNTTVQLEAWKEDFSKQVYLTVTKSNFVYQDLMADTVCPGDSVKMINSYAKNEGWNYEVLETTSIGSDTIFRMYLHHYPAYHEVVHRAAVERDSLPYIYGKDTIRNFGLTELQRYQTVNGCDSIIYVQLDPVYRAQHFYDTMEFCGTATVQWRGVKMIVYRTGDYIDSTSEADRGGAKNYYHLHVAISSPYSITYTDSCYIEELPYAVGGRPMEAYGTHTENLVSAAGCDSVCHYVLSRRWHWYRVNVKVRGEGSVNVTDTVLREDGSMWLAFSASPCYALERVTVDGRAVPLQEIFELKDLHGDCTVEVTFASLASAETRVERQACRDSLPIVYNGELYGEGEHTMMLRNAVGCDSVVKLYVQGKENVARLAVVDTIAPLCGVSEIAFSYNIEAGSPRWLRLAFDPVAEKAGFRDTVLAVGSTGGQTVRLALPPSAGPDRYGLRLWQTDVSGCYAPVDDMFFEIPYPSDIIVQKWSDVLAVLSADYNGGYEFSGYQWYKNGEAIEGATKPYYQAKPYLRSSDTYAVLLERASDGLRLQSCGVKRKGYPKELVLELLPNPTVSGEAVTVRVGGKPDAEGIIEVFDGVGKPVYERPFRESHILRADWQPGSYVVRVRNAKSTWIATGKLIVR